MKPVAEKAVVMGASAGALEALSCVLIELPADYRPAILIVVHVPSGKSSLLASLLQAKCALPVQEAEDKEPICAGHVYIAPPDYHLLVEEGKYLSLSNEEEVMFSRPSIDVLFESAADAFGEALTGVVLTGANSDGALGLQAVMQAGGHAVVQRASDAYAQAMPQAALKACPQAQVLGLKEIGHYLVEAA